MWVRERNRNMKLLKSFLIAVSMYSKIPVPSVEWEKDAMKYAMCFFPVIGVVTGAVSFVAAYGLRTYTHCGSFFFGAVMTAIPVLITGGIHLDGFADTVDALSSYGDREKKLEILKDPHTGAFALIGVCTYLILNLAFWSEAKLSVFPAAACIYPFSRALSGIAVVSFPPAKKSGLLRTFQDGAQKRRVCTVLTVWAVLSGVLLVWLSPVPGTAALAAGLLVFGYYYRMAVRQFGGATGDLAGYFLQLCELVMLAAVVIGGGCI